MNQNCSVDTKSVLFIGDVVGRKGRQMLSKNLPVLIERYQPSLVVVNGENSAGGFGVDESTYKEILAAGAEVITSGNHIWKRKEVYKLLEQKDSKLLRPANYPQGSSGRGVYLDGASGIAIVNLQGRVFMNDLVDCPFQKIDKLLMDELADIPHIIVDFHAEATSEKMAFAAHVEGRVSGVFGTHTHVQTADEGILPGGTAYISDVGMTGPYRGVIGMESAPIVRKFNSAIPERFGVAKGPGQINGVIVKLALDTGKALSIERILEKEET